MTIGRKIIIEERQRRQPIVQVEDIITSMYSYRDVHNPICLFLSLKNNINLQVVFLLLILLQFPIPAILLVLLLVDYSLSVIGKSETTLNEL